MQIRQFISFKKGHILKSILLAGFGLACAGFLLLFFAAIIINYQLPDADKLTQYQPDIPLRIYSEDDVLLGEFGAEKRERISIQEVPAFLKKAILSVEDARFYEHEGIDYTGILRALITDIIHVEARQGASTITMQVARNLFLSNEKTITRKLYEILLARKIEQTLSKDQILEIYMNQIYLGQRAYGFATAARVYFNKSLPEITIAEAAMLAGLPKAPAAYNPIVNPQRAIIRQKYVLQRMLDTNSITQDEFNLAINEPLHVALAADPNRIHAEYVNEMVRQFVFSKYQEETYTKGYIVKTMIRAADQEAAYQAVRKGVLAYDKRHSYHGPEGLVTVPDGDNERSELLITTLNQYPNLANVLTAIVISASTKEVTALIHTGDTIRVTGSGLDFASRALQAKASEKLKIKKGSIIRVMNIDDHWFIVQQPGVESGLVSITPQTGAIRALVGGFDFTRNHFNHVTQAWRQPGSSFKPFMYSAALEKGYGPATTINDSPLQYEHEDENEEAWVPKDESTPEGLVSLRIAVQKSINLAAIRVLDAITPKYAQTFITSTFGFSPDKIQPYLSMALGAGEVTPMQLASAYSIFANGGYQISPYLITNITDINGNILYESEPATVEKGAKRVIDERNSYIMTSLLRSVAQHGTGALSNQIGRSDLSGKTGTTNNAYDGWFAGYQQSLVSVVWMGYDKPQSLGKDEFGSRVALPIWVDYMKQALKNAPPENRPLPANIALIGGELYYDNFTPGHGFVSSVGVNFSDSIAHFFKWGNNNNETATRTDKNDKSSTPERHTPAAGQDIIQEK